MSGFDFFLKKEKELNSEFEAFNSIMGREVPDSVKTYFLNFEPIDIFDNDVMNPDILEKIEMGELDVCAVFNKRDIVIEEFYSIQQVLSQIEINSDLYSTLCVFPIIKSLGRTEIVVSLNDDTYGKIYYVIDWGVTELSDVVFCSNTINEFVKEVQIVG